jgi:hypothetical protein
MTDEQTITMTAADARSLAQKLEQFSQTLSPGEQAALQRLLDEAMTVAVGGEDVRGYSLSTLPLPEGDLMKAFGVS